MYKIKPGALTAGAVKSNFQATFERFVPRDNVHSIMRSVKETLAF